MNFTSEQLEMVTEIRSSFKEAKGRELKLTPELIVTIIDNAKGFEDMEFDDQIKLFEKAEEEAAKVSAVTIDPGITRLVEKFDDEIEAALSENLDAVEKSKSSAIDVYAQLKRIWTLEEFNSTPFPGSTEKTVKGNKQPDIVKTEDQTGKSITINWWNDFVFTTKRGKALEAEIDEYSAELKTAGAVPRLSKYSKKELTAMKAGAVQRRNALRSMFKRAAALHHMYEAIRSMPLVEIEFITVRQNGIRVPQEFGHGHNCEHDEVTKSPKPFWMYPKGKASEGREFSVTQIINMDVELAMSNGGTMANLTDTLSKGADEGGEVDSGDGVEMADDIAQETLSRFYNWFNNRDHQMVVLKKIANRKADPDGDDWLDLIGSIYLAVKPIYEKNKAAYEEVIHKEKKAA